MKVRIAMKAVINTLKVHWPNALNAGLKVFLLSIVGCAFVGMGDSETAWVVFEWLLFGCIPAIMALILFVPVIMIFITGKAKAMARVKVNFQKVWGEVWSEPFRFL